MLQIVLRIKKILITLVAGLALAGCSGWKDFTIVHTPEIQQGNIVTPEMVAELKPGMSKRQVRFLLGTPLLVDIFHQERWDYLFTMKKRNESLEIKQFSLFFEDDTLISFQGDIEPAKDIESLRDKQEIVVSVPDYDGDKGIIERLLSAIGIDLDD
ncbi:MAG: outer membrane protein assembly factor BamE [Gammaproteobacteria bacterium]|nr:outer membrane protein assembly factor BamE [Gammaproteobacteria bacterium]